jgi:hypothetical protein
MRFVELPERFNCSHNPQFSPVLVRFEGGNERAGFCIHEYTRTPPHVGLYGDLEIAKTQWEQSLKILHHYIGVLNEFGSPRSTTIGTFNQSWFSLDARDDDYPVTVSFNQRISMIPLGSPNWQAVDENLTHAYKRMNLLFEKFYDQS